MNRRSYLARAVGLTTAFAGVAGCTMPTRTETRGSETGTSTVTADERSWTHSRVWHTDEAFVGQVIHVGEHEFGLRPNEYDLASPFVAVTDGGESARSCLESDLPADAYRHETTVELRVAMKESVRSW